MLLYFYNHSSLQRNGMYVSEINLDFLKLNLFKNIMGVKNE